MKFLLCLLIFFSVYKINANGLYRWKIKLIPMNNELNSLKKMKFYISIIRNPLISGCKIVDLLDCLIEGREVQSFHVSSGRGGRGEMVTMRLRYLIKRAWFTCLRIPKPHDENSWKDEQCFMYLRLRRLVCNVNQHLFEKIHFERERMIQVINELYQQFSILQNCTKAPPSLIVH